MKWLGSVLLLWSGFFLRSKLIQRSFEEIAQGEELCESLLYLRHGIFRLQKPLPELIRACHQRSRYTSIFWASLLEGMQKEAPFLWIWRESCGILAGPYVSLWKGLAQSLLTGEQEEVMEQTREELYRIVQEKRRQKREKDKLVTTVCLSGTLLLVVVLL